jgi:hypothetical protein
MQIGDSVTYKGRSYTVVGFTPMSVIPAEIELRDPQTGATFWVEWPPAAPAERAALRIATEKNTDPPR